MNNDDKIEQIKRWLGTGSVNIFGLPYSGKDTVGKRLAIDLGAEFLSSGDLLRAVNEKDQESGQLSPTNVFYDVVLPAFARPEFNDKPLILSSIGRWQGEEQRVMEATNTNNHPIKAVISLNISKDEVQRRYRISLRLGDRSNRADASDEKIATRLKEYKTKTLPVINTYRQMGLLIEVNGEQSRDAAYDDVVNELFDFTNT